MRANRRMLVLVSTGLISGCSQNLPSPSLPVPLASTFTPHPSAVLTNAIAVRTEWWRSFRSPELDMLEARALAASPDLSAATARITQARGNAAIARAPLFPSVGVQGDASTNPSGPLGSRPTIAALATYEVDFWGRNRAQASSGAMLAEAAQFDRETVAITLTSSVAESYFAVRSLRTRLALARRIATDAARTLRLVEAQRQVGTGSDLQVQLQRNLLAGFDQSAASLERQIEQEQHSLAVLTGQAPQGFSAAPGGTPEPVTPVVEASTPIALLVQRPDIAAAEARLAAARFDVRAARAAFLPSVTLSAIAGLLASPAASAAIVGSSLSAPLFRGGALDGRAKVDQARADELLASYHGTVLNALRDVEDALSEQAWLERESQAAERAVIAAQRAAFLSEAQYRLGASDYLTVLTAERLWYQAEDTKAQLHAQRLRAAVALFRALGGGFTKEKP